MITSEDIIRLLRPCEHCAHFSICVTTGPVPKHCAVDYSEIAIDMILKGEYYG